MTAARTGSLRVVASLLDRGADVQAKEANGQTALMWAVAEQHGEVARALVERKADVAAQSANGFTALHFAARSGNLAIAERLLQAGADINQPAKDGSSALLVATVRGHVALAKALLDRGADPNGAGAGYTPLHWAAGVWDTELTGPRGISSERDEEWRSLGGLDRAGKTDLIQSLLAHGANPNARLSKTPPRTGFSVFRVNLLTDATPFFLAAMAGDVETMRLLVDAGADARLGVKDNTTPLMAAAGVGRVLAETKVTTDASYQAGKLAWELGNDVNATNQAGETALHGAAHIRSDALVQFLVEKGASLNVKNRRGETPLFIAERTVSAGSAPVIGRSTTGDLLRKLGAEGPPPPDAK